MPRPPKVSPQKLAANRSNLLRANAVRSQLTPAERSAQMKAVRQARSRYEALALRIHPRLDSSERAVLGRGDLSPLRRLARGFDVSPDDDVSLSRIARAISRLDLTTTTPDSRRKATTNAREARRRYAALALAAAPHLTAADRAELAAGNYRSLKRLAESDILDAAASDFPGAARALLRLSGNG
jgi:hypothetical protein